MRTERLARGEEGFTLVEVLAAMVILAVGLLGLEALGIGAAKSIASAELQSRYASTAVRRMEQKQAEIRRAPTAVSTGSQCATDSPSGYYVCTNVQTASTLGSLPAHEAKVTVQVARRSGDPAFTVTSYVFHPSLP